MFTNFKMECSRIICSDGMFLDYSCILDAVKYFVDLCFSSLSGVV